MKDKYRFNGDTWRVKLTIFDWSNNKEPTKFCVQKLPQNAHQFHAFAKGEKLYYGTDFKIAWNVITQNVPRVRFPDTLKRYAISQNPSKE